MKACLFVHVRIELLGDWKFAIVFEKKKKSIENYKARERCKRRLLFFEEREKIVHCKQISQSNVIEYIFLGGLKYLRYNFLKFSKVYQFELPRVSEINIHGIGVLF